MQESGVVLEESLAGGIGVRPEMHRAPREQRHPGRTETVRARGGDDAGALVMGIVETGLDERGGGALRFYPRCTTTSSKAAPA